MKKILAIVVTALVLLVGAPAVHTFRAEGPGAVGFDAKQDAVRVQAVWRVVGIQHVNAEDLVGMCPDECPRHPVMVGRLIDVREDKLVHLGDQVIGAEGKLFALVSGGGLGARPSGIVLRGVAEEGA